MRNVVVGLTFVLSTLAAVALAAPAPAPTPPAVDHHQHLLSPPAAQLVNTHLKTSEKPVFGADLVRLLDEAGIRRAVVLSNAYYFDSPPAQGLPNYVAMVRAENDWTAVEAGRFRDRLVAFCSINPLLPHALPELDRCAANPVFRGLKLHFNISGVDVLNPEHVAKVRTVFAAANRHRMPILVHASVPGSPPYGAPHARALLEELVPAAPDVPVVIGHLWGGAGFAPDALAVYVDAMSSRRAEAGNLYFEVAQSQLAARGSPETLKQIAAAIRQIGIDRVFYGSDGPQFGGQSPAQAWKEFRDTVPLTAEEHKRLFRNVAPFLRSPGERG